MSKKVIDLFTRKPLTTTQDTEQNDEQTSEVGRFAGSISKEKAESLRIHQESTESLGAQIDNLMGDYLFMLDLHNTNMQYVIEKLRIKYDPETEIIMVSEDGKVWVVPREDME
jgi:hypothetical protein